MEGEEIDGRSTRNDKHWMVEGFKGEGGVLGKR